MGSADAFQLAAISAVAAAISAFVTAITAMGVFLQARVAGKASAAALFLSFSERYNSIEMATALRHLARWRLSCSDQFAIEWALSKSKQESGALQLNEYRRIVSRFYFDVARLYEVGLIGRKHAKALLANNGLNVFYQVCEPMNIATHPDRVSTHTVMLKDLLPSYGTGKLHLVRVETK
jgi:hypothetical protein